jgi:SAM-dependent methyltransferase
MNEGLPHDHASITYYDGDYPWRGDPRAPSNFDEIVAHQGLAFDVDFYLRLAAGVQGAILDLCCGTGRVTVPLARAGHRVVGVDISAGQLAGLTSNLKNESAEVAARVTAIEGDIAQIELGATFGLIVVAFNSLCCLTTSDAQCLALRAIERHLDPDGVVALDLVNPLKLALQGDAVPKPFFTRINPRTGNRYTRFAMSDPFDEDHRQRLHGWYDEIDAAGNVARRFYSLHWRPIFLPELRHMLSGAGLAVRHLYGGHRQEPFTAQSAKLVVVASRAH